MSIREADDPEGIGDTLLVVLDSHERQTVVHVVVPDLDGRLLSTIERQGGAGAGGGAQADVAPVDLLAGWVLPQPSRCRNLRRRRRRCRAGATGSAQQFRILMLKSPPKLDRPFRRPSVPESRGNWSQVRPSSSRPAFFLFFPPHCLKKKGTRARGRDRAQCLHPSLGPSVALGAQIRHLR